MAKTKRLWLLASLTALGLSAGACSSSSSTPPPPPPPTTYVIGGTITGAASVTVALSGTSSGTTTTDGTGKYSFIGLANGTYTVTPSKVGYAFNPVSTLVTLSGADATGKDFAATVAANTYSIAGAVSGAITDGVLVTLSGSASGTVNTSGGGTYAFAGLANGSYTVTPTKVGYGFNPASRTLVVNGADMPGQGFVATALTYTLSGNVAGATVVTVNLTGAATASAVTDGSGNFSFSVTNGSYTLTPSKAGYTFTPASRPVTVLGADVLAQDFTAAVGTTYTISGTVTGPWVEGINVTLGGAAAATTTTSASGTYIFTGLANEVYTLTPSLDGYTYSPAAPSVTMSGANKTQDFTASSALPSYSISGTVTYAGSKTGRVYLQAFSNTCGNCSAFGGTSISAPGSYTIRGLQADTYTIQAHMDIGNAGANNTNDPAGSAPFTVAANVTGKNVTLLDPAPVAAPPPTNFFAQPGNSSMLMFWDVAGSPSTESATSYEISWGTDVNATNGGVIAVAARDDGHYFQSGLADATPYYYKIRSLVVGAASSSYSAVLGPIPAGAITGAGNSISGTVSFTGTATGPLYVGVFDQSSGTFRFTRYAAPVTSPKPFTITGVPAGTYFLFGIVDQNNDGIIDDGDLSNTGGSVASAVTVTGADLTGQSFALPTVSALASTTTERTSPASGSAFYSLGNRVSNGTKRLVAVTLVSGKNIPVPADVALQWDFSIWSYLGASVPTVGDTYTFRVAFSDGTTGTVSSSVTAVLSSFAQVLTETTTGSYSFGVPLFSWTAPASPPASYGYTVSLNGNGGANWYYPNSNTPLPSSTLQVVYNADGRASPSTLTTGTYTWGVSVQDADGNRATKQRNYVVP